MKSVKIGFLARNIMTRKKTQIARNSFTRLRAF